MRRYQVLTGVLMYLAHVTRYDTLYAVNQLVKAMSKPTKDIYEAVKQMLCCLAGSKDFSVAFKQDGFRLDPFSGANWGNNRNNGRSTSS